MPSRGSLRWVVAVVAALLALLGFAAFVELRAASSLQPPADAQFVAGQAFPVFLAEGEGRVVYVKDVPRVLVNCTAQTRSGPDATEEAVEARVSVNSWRAVLSLTARRTGTISLRCQGPPQARFGVGGAIPPRHVVDGAKRIPAHRGAYVWSALLALVAVAALVSPTQGPRSVAMYWVGAPLIVTAVFAATFNSVVVGGVAGGVSLAVLAALNAVRPKMPWIRWKLLWPGWASIPAIALLLTATGIWQHASGAEGPSSGLAAVFGFAGVGVVALLFIAVAAIPMQPIVKSWLNRFAGPLLLILVVVLAFRTVLAGAVVTLFWFIVMRVDDPRENAEFLPVQSAGPESPQGDRQAEPSIPAESGRAPARESRVRWGRLVQNVIGVAGFLVVLNGILHGGWTWYGAAVALSFVLLIAFGFDRILRAAVVRDADGIVCRYTPGSDGRTYAGLSIGLMGIGIIGTGLQPGGTRLAFIPGVILVALLPLTIAAAVVSRRNRVRISLPALTVRSGRRRAKTIVIGRDDVESIRLKSVHVGRGDVDVVEIDYRTADSGTETQTVRIGYQGVMLTVETGDIFAALTAWKRGVDPGQDPIGWLDGIEATLRGRPILRL